MTNSEKALQAFNDSNFKEAANIWINGYCLPEDTTTLRYIFDTCQDKVDPDIYALLGFIYLDYSSEFTDDRVNALLQVVTWSKQGLVLNPSHHLCARHAGSALYWLEDYEGAWKYYEQAVALSPSATLQVRLFKMSGCTDYHQLQIDMNGI
jgi:tetratricopeptide (TPR) repeat protein